MRDVDVARATTRSVRLRPSGGEELPVVGETVREVAQDVDVEGPRARVGRVGRAGARGGRRRHRSCRP